MIEILLTKTSHIILATFTSFIILFGLQVGNVLAQNCNDPNLTTQQAIQCGVNRAAGQKSGNASEQGLQRTINRLVNVLSIIVGIAAVIMMIIGGFRYITSGGDATRVGNAKNTILYAVIGLIVVALAQVIVRFVIGTTQ